jgi:hypothetical protein
MTRKIAVLALLLFGCAAALHVIRTVIDIADDLCVATLSDPNLDPSMAVLLAGRTPQEACKAADVARVFVDQVKSAQRASLHQMKMEH